LPVSQTMPHVELLHVACPCPLGTLQTVHDGPHAVASSLALHAVPHK